MFFGGHGFTMNLSPYRKSWVVFDLVFISGWWGVCRVSVWNSVVRACWSLRSSGCFLWSVPCVLSSVWVFVSMGLCVVPSVLRDCSLAFLALSFLFLFL